MIQPKGLDSPFQLLFDDSPHNGLSLAPEFHSFYGGDWSMPSASVRPYVYSNFAQSRDGRVSYNEPGIASGGDITNFNPHDRWLMGLLRARADAVMMGDNTVKIESGHMWTAEAICPNEATAFAQLRKQEERSEIPLLVILSFDGQLGYHQQCFQEPATRILLATTMRGAEFAKQVQIPAQLTVLALGEESVDLPRLLKILRTEYAITHLLCEGGPRLFAGMLDAGLIDHEFVTLCPNFVGRTADRFRPSYCENVAWRPENAPYSKPISLRRAGDLLFMQTQCLYKR